jgi:hypothetical protein
MSAIRRSRAISVLAAAVVAVSVSACATWGGPQIGELFATPDSTMPDPTGWQLAPGQTPTIITPDPSIAMSVDVPVTLFTNTNPDMVVPGSTAPATFTVGASPVHVVVVATYHYVTPSGVPGTGQISLRGPGGEVLGPWPTIGTEGQGGIANAVWSANVDLILSAGAYTVIDSDTATWSANEGTGGAGMFWINGDAPAP